MIITVLNSNICTKLTVFNWLKVYYWRVERKLNNFKITIIQHLLTENEKCLLNQALNLQRTEIYKDCRNGHNSDYKQDIEDLDRLMKMVKNKLWY